MKYTISILSINALVYLALSFISHRVSAADYGSIVYYCSLCSTLSFLFMFGRTELELREIAITKRALQIAPLLLSITAFLTFMLLWRYFGRNTGILSFDFCLPMGLSLIVGEYLAVLLRTRRQFGALALLGRPVNVLYLFAAVWVGIASWDARLFPEIAVAILFVYCGLVLYFGRQKGVLNISPNQLVDNRSFPFWISGVLHLLNLQGASLVLGYHGHLKEVGEYSLALLVATTSSMVYSSYFSVYSLTSFYEERSKSATDGAAFVLLALLRATILAAFLIATAFLVIVFLYPVFFDLHKYGNLRNLSLLMLIVIGLRAWQSALAMFMSLEGKLTKKNLISFFAYSGGTLFGWISLDRYGVYGFCAGLIFSEFALLCGFLISFRNEVRRLNLDVIALTFSSMSVVLGEVCAALRRVKKRITGKTDIAVLGYYGFNNYGDDLFVFSVYARLRELGFDDTACFTVKFVGPRIPAIPSKYFPRLASALPGLYRSNSPFGVAFRGIVKASILATAEKIIYAGGSLFLDPSRSRLRTERAMMRSGVSFYALGISVGPFRNYSEERRVIEHLRAFSAVVVRDRRSQRMLVERGVPSELAPDIVLSLDLPFTSHLRPHGRPKEILLVPVKLCGALGTKQTEFYGALIDRALANGWAVTLATLQSAADDSERLHTERDIPAIYYQGDLDRFTADLGKYDYIFTSRLHGAVVAAALGVPFYLFQHHQKCTDFLDEISWPYANSLSPEHVSASPEEIFDRMSYSFDMEACKTNARLKIDETLNAAFRTKVYA